MQLFGRAMRLGADQAQVMLAEYTGPQYEIETRATVILLKLQDSSIHYCLISCGVVEIAKLCFASCLKLGILNGYR